MGPAEPARLPSTLAALCDALERTPYPRQSQHLHISVQHPLLKIHAWLSVPCRQQRPAFLALDPQPSKEHFFPPYQRKAPPQQISKANVSMASTKAGKTYPVAEAEALVDDVVLAALHLALAGASLLLVAEGPPHFGLGLSALRSGSLGGICTVARGQQRTFKAPFCLPRLDEPLRFRHRDVDGVHDEPQGSLDVAAQGQVATVASGTPRGGHAGDWCAEHVSELTGGARLRQKENRSIPAGATRNAVVEITAQTPLLARALKGLQCAPTGDYCLWVHLRLQK
jgi:hypothetical protein